MAPFFNGYAETVRPIVYQSLMDYEPPEAVDLEIAAAEPTDEEASKVGMGPLGLAGWEVAPDGTIASDGTIDQLEPQTGAVRGTLKREPGKPQRPASPAGLK